MPILRKLSLRHYNSCSTTTPPSTRSETHLSTSFDSSWKPCTSTTTSQQAHRHQTRQVQHHSSFSPAAPDIHNHLRSRQSGSVPSPLPTTIHHRCNPLDCQIQDCCARRQISWPFPLQLHPLPSPPMSFHPKSIPSLPPPNFSGSSLHYRWTRESVHGLLKSESG